ncbi:MFS transporter [Achromobacter aloeverae]|uniref:MFS transporter n=1 Tax=Achromobacter aloeverae TaxID=1750518 RepID=A0A4Q1HNZ7_9BURK|nr:MFS transporter [Achromobacter aloeverae]RXN91575.1 MFS transporter [Achromobacter aloeverae]
MNAIRPHSDVPPNAEGPSSRGNATVLAIAQGLFTASIAVDLTLTGLTGYQLAPDKSLATLPFAMITVAAAVVTLFASLLMQRLGRRWGFIIGAVTGGMGGLVSVWAVIHGHFWLFCIGTAAVGVFQAFAQYYRLAAADAVEEAHKARVISIVLTGGVIAAVLGPALAAWSRDLMSTVFAGSYMVVALLGFLSALLIGVCYRDVEPTGVLKQDAELPPRPVGVVLRQPISLAALANNAIGGVVMMFTMTAAPLAAVACHHTIDDGANIIQWHLVGMYAPSFFAGRLIKRLGMPAVLFAGMGLSALCGIVAMSSTTLSSFYVALLCLGIGWNFMYVGGTALLASSHRPSERARVQGTAELIRYVLTALATLGAGPVLERYGWTSLNLVTFPLLALAAAMTLLWVRAARRAKAMPANVLSSSR